MTTKRLNYTYGQFLTAADFQAEQDYHRSQRHQHNLALFTPGVLNGLAVTGTANDTKVSVSAGLALDGQGRTLIQGGAATLDLAPFAGKQFLLLTFAFDEFDDPADTLPADKVPGAKGPISTRKTERTLLTLTPVTPDPKYTDGLPPPDNLALRLAVVVLNAPDFKTIKEVVLNARQNATSRSPAVTGLPRLDVSGDSTLGGKLAVAGAASLGGSLQVSGAALFNGDVQIKGKFALPTPLGLGLGAATPAAALTVNANIGGLGPGVPGIMLGNPSGTTAIWQGKDSNNYVEMSWLDDGAGSGRARVFTGGNKPVVFQEYGGNVGIGTTNPSARLHVGGTLKVDGAKTGYVADQFVNRIGETLELGDVVVIGDASPAFHYGVRDTIPTPEVDYASGAYDTRVCGIVCEVHGEMVDAAPAKSAAKADKKGKKAAPAARLFSEGELAERDIGKVGPGQIGLMVTLGAFAHCKVDADIAEIKAGDLLTTSPTPGHAQKVLDRGQALGAIVGKALAPLKKGRGRIPVMVMLQ